MIDLAGIIPATVTPMLDSQRIDHAAIPPYVERLIAAGALGLAVNVDTGEGPHLTRDERRSVLETVVGTAAGRVRVVAGVGGPSTADGVANALIAREAGADALLVFPIGAFLSQPLRTDIVVGYHQAIADAADLPIVLFQLQPMLGGVLYPSEVLDGLLAIPQVVAIKEASFDPLRWLALKAHLNAAPRHITLLTGNDNFIARELPAGRRGRAAGFRDAADRGARGAPGRRAVPVMSPVPRCSAGRSRTSPTSSSRRPWRTTGRVPRKPCDDGLDPQHHRPATAARASTMPTGRVSGRAWSPPACSADARRAVDAASVSRASPGPHVDRLQGVVDASIPAIRVGVQLVVRGSGTSTSGQHADGRPRSGRRVREPADARGSQECRPVRGRLRFREPFHDAAGHVRLDGHPERDRGRHRPAPGCGHRPDRAHPARRRCPAARRRSPPGPRDTGGAGRGPVADRGRCPAPGRSSGA